MWLIGDSQLVNLSENGCWLFLCQLGVMVSPYTPV